MYRYTVKTTFKNRPNLYDTVYAAYEDDAINQIYTKLSDKMVNQIESISIIYSECLDGNATSPIYSR